MARINTSNPPAPTSPTKEPDATSEPVNNATDDGVARPVDDTAGRDRWESAKASGAQIFASVTGAAGQVRDQGDAIRQAIAGPADSETTVGLQTLAQWFEPEPEFLSHLEDTRGELQEQITALANNFDVEILETALTHSASTAGDLSARIESRLGAIGEARQPYSPAGDRLKEDLQQLDIAVRREAADKANTVLNAAADVAADHILHHRESITGLGQAMQAIADFGVDRENPVLSTILPRASASEVSARWTLGSLGKAIEGSVEIAEYFATTPGLPTEDNFEEWIAQIEPGESLHVEGRFLASLAAPLGLRAGGGGSLVIDRCEVDPNRVSLTIGRDAELALLVGKQFQDQGASLGRGARGDSALQFDFDLRNPEHIAQMGELALANQLGVAPASTVKAAEQHLVSTTISAEAFADGSGELMDISASKDLFVGAALQREIRDTGPVDRILFNAGSEWSLGSSFGEIPADLMDDLAASAPAGDHRLGAEMLSQLTNGQLGMEASASQNLNVGIEWEENRAERLFVEQEFDGQAFGHHQGIRAEFVIHDLPQLAEDMDMTSRDLAELATQGELDISRLYQAVDAQGMDSSEVFGITLHSVQNHRDGFGVDIMGVDLSSTVQRTDEELLWQAGTSIDKTPRSLDDIGSQPSSSFVEETSRRLLDRFLNA